MAKLTRTIIEAAINGFEAQKKTIDAQIAELRAMMNGGPSSPLAEETKPERKKRKISKEALQRMREGQRRRWAKMRGELPIAPAQKSSGRAKPKKGLTAAGRKALSIAMKRRWAAKKAAAA